MTWPCISIRFVKWLNERVFLFHAVTFEAWLKLFFSYFFSLLKKKEKIHSLPQKICLSGWNLKQVEQNIPGWQLLFSHRLMDHSRPYLHSETIWNLEKTCLKRDSTLIMRDRFIRFMYHNNWCGGLKLFRRFASLGQTTMYSIHHWMLW